MRTGNMTGFEVDLEPSGVATILFNRPEQLNSMTRSCKRDLTETLTQAQMDDRVRIILFEAEGPAFIAGDDLDRHRQTHDRPTLVDDLPYDSQAPIRTYESLRINSQVLIRTLSSITKVTIAAINGHAVQSGLTLALACDFRVAGESAKLSSGTLRMGYLPDEGGHWFLAQMLGRPKALEFILRNRVVTAAEALELGLVNQVVADSDLRSTVLELARELADGPQVAQRLAKRAVINAEHLMLDQAMDDIAGKAALTDHHDDAHAGRLAFMEHRQPEFNAWLQEAATRAPAGDS